jgi:hypothetical protein
MGKKNRGKDDASSDEEPEPEEEVESKFAKRKRERGRAAFMRMVRVVLSWALVGMVVSQQAFVIKPRAPGVNRGKVVPLQLAICGAVRWAEFSPTFVRNPYLGAYLNMTGRALLTPFEYGRTQQSKRATDKEKTISAAFKKSERAFTRVVDKETSLIQIAAMPQPNFPFIGAGLVTLGALAAALMAGPEYLVIAGCGLLSYGSRGLGMEPQPELYVTGVLAVLGILATDAGKVKKEDSPPKASKKKRK